MELQQGGEGEKSDLVASSQKALSRAAHLVADAAEIRKREAHAVMDQINHMTYKHLSCRLETLLPHNVVSSELSAVRGELLAAKVIGKASLTLEGIASTFRKSIRPPLPTTASNDSQTVSGSLDVQLSDEAQQQISTMLHQAEFAHEIADVSSELLRLLVAGQWPDFLTPEKSVELGSILGHALPELDTMLEQVLKTLKTEGGLAVEQANIGELRLTIQTTLHSMRNDLDRDDVSIVSASWEPPGWALLKDVSMAKFSLLASAAALSIGVDAETGASNDRSRLNDLYNKVEQSASQASTACLRLANLDPNNDKVLAELTAMSRDLAVQAKTLEKAISSLLMNHDTSESCYALTNDILRCLAKLLLVLRAENWHPNEGDRHHAMSPEAFDAWNGISNLARNIRSLDGDVEDVNYLHRAHAVEARLGDAVENEPKLPMLTAKVANLEKVRFDCSLLSMDAYPLLTCVSMFALVLSDYFLSHQGNCYAKCPFIGIGKALGKEQFYAGRAKQEL